MYTASIVISVALSGRSPGFPGTVAFPSPQEQWLVLTAPGSFYGTDIGITVAGPLRILTGIPWLLNNCIK
jgi:hypothetical protein